jgi:hypothetical protein
MGNTLIIYKGIKIYNEVVFEIPSKLNKYAFTTNVRLPVIEKAMSIMISWKFDVIPHLFFSLFICLI